MFLSKNTGGEDLWGVAVENRHRILQKNGAGIHSLINNMNGTAGQLDTICQCLALSIESRKGGQERGMNVEDAVGEIADQLGTQKPHKATQNQKIGGISGNNAANVRFCFLSSLFVRDDFNRNAGGTRLPNG